jgi:alpha-L-fucosidase 2
LPDAWKDGSVKGLCARGGFEIAIEWKNKVLTRVVVTAKADAKTTLISGDKKVVMELKRGEKKELVW